MVCKRYVNKRRGWRSTIYLGGGACSRFIIRKNADRKYRFRILIFKKERGPIRKIVFLVILGWNNEKIQGKDDGEVNTG